MMHQSCCRVGYAACHWCHVMAHESFEDEATAAYLNEHFVSIKVDREERPDVDAVYMNATTSMTGQGGWPMTCVLDHDGNPFFAGTYFPDQPRHGSPSFRQVLAALVDAWDNRGDDVRRVAGTVREHLNQVAALAGGPIGREQVDAAVQTLAGEFDPRNAGFGGAPKFPPSMVLEFLLRAHGSTGTRRAQMLDATCEAMARGGIYDQLGGGFARYSVDAQWVVPHFEKMLYDNAQLVGLYARWGGPLGERVAAGTADFLLRELRTAEGGFASALDADSEGVEGKFYAWTPAELVEVLGRRRRRLGGPGCFEVTEAGTFEHGASTLQLLDDPEGLGAARLDARPGAAARGARDPGPARARRQGRGGLERAGDQRTLRRRAPARSRGVRRRRDRCRSPAGRPARRRRPAAPRLPRRRRRPARGRARGPRLRRLRLPLPRPGDRRRRLARPRAGAARRRARPTSGPTTAASSTPPTTPRRWSPGPATRATTPARRASRRWSTRWSPRTR